MKRTVTVIALALLVAPHIAFADTDGYWDCILDKMPGVENDVTAYSIRRLCSQKNNYNPNIPATKRTGWFDFESGAECTAKKSKDTRSTLGARAVMSACYAFYEPVNPFDQFTK